MKTRSKNPRNTSSGLLHGRVVVLNASESVSFMLGRSSREVVALLLSPLPPLLDVATRISTVVPSLVPTMVTLYAAALSDPVMTLPPLPAEFPPLSALDSVALLITAAKPAAGYHSAQRSITTHTS